MRRLLTKCANRAIFIHPATNGGTLDSYEFARGMARVMDRDNESGLAQLVEERRAKLIRVTDPNRPYRVLAHIIVDKVAPEHVPGLLPKGVVTVRKAAQILADIAAHTRVTPVGTPVVLDRDMLLFVRKMAFTYFLHLLTFKSYDQMEGKPQEKEDESAGEVEVRFSATGIFFSRAAIMRWTAVIFDPGRFEIVADFLRSVDPDEYRLWYFRILAAAVSSKEPPDEDALRQLLRDLRHPPVMN